MNAIFDVIISFVVGGLMLLTALQMDSSVKSHAMNSTYELATMENLNAYKEIIEHDFRKIGHGLRRPQSAITLADTSRIIFSYDRNNHSPSTSVIDSVRIEYVMLPDNTTPNPSDKILKRIVNGQSTTGPALGLTRFRLRYFNRYFTQLATPVVTDSLSRIRRIEVTMVVQSKESVEKQYDSQSQQFEDEYKENMMVTFFTPKNLLPK